MSDNILLETAKDAKALFIFAHGAGADMNSSFMSEISNALVTQHQISVLRFNFPYMNKRLIDGKRYPPDRMNKLIPAFIEVVNEHKTRLPVFVGGKSMGSRVAASIANEINTQGVVCLGYPFHPQKKPENLRLEPLQDCCKPVLIVQGERDALGSKEEISSYQLPKHCQLSFLADGDHDLKPRVKSGYTHAQHKETAIQSIAEFIRDNS